MTFPILCKLVAVAWVDSGLRPGWEELEALRTELGKSESAVHCRSVGWVVHEDECRLVIASSQNNSDQVAGGMDIPRSAIVSVVRLGPLGGEDDGPLPPYGV
jgi:hypothetical protein